MDEDALHVLLADDIDPATAVVASTADHQPQPRATQGGTLLPVNLPEAKGHVRFWWSLGLLIGLAAVVWWFLR